MAKLPCGSPDTDTQPANQWDGEQLGHPPLTPELSRYDSGIVIDTQFHGNFNKIGSKDRTPFRRSGKLVQVEWTQDGLPGFWALGWHKVPCRVESACLLGSHGQCSVHTGAPIPVLCLLPLNSPPSPCSGSQSCLYWIARSDLAGSQGTSLKNNQMLPGVGVGCQEWLRPSRLSFPPHPFMCSEAESGLPGGRRELGRECSMSGQGLVWVGQAGGSPLSLGGLCPGLLMFFCVGF